VVNKSLGQRDPEEWPNITEALLKVLQERFPEKCIRSGESLEEAHRYAGKVELIQFLKQVRQLQRERK